MRAKLTALIALLGCVTGLAIAAPPVPQWWAAKQSLSATPTPTITPFLNYDASIDCLGQTDGTQLATWTNRGSKASADATQSNASHRPECQTAGGDTLNGLPVLGFVGSEQDDLGVPDNTLSGVTAATLFVVVKIDNDPPSGSNYGSWALDAANFAGTYPFTDGVIYESFGTTVRKNATDPAASLASWRIYTVVSATTDYRVYLDDTTLLTTAVNVVGFNNTGLLLGADDGGSGYLDGRMAQLVVYDSGLSDSDRTATKAALAAKWGL